MAFNGLIYYLCFGTGHDKNTLDIIVRNCRIRSWSSDRHARSFHNPTCSHARPAICNLNRHQVSSSYSRLDFAIFTHIKYKHVSIIIAISMTPGTSGIFRVSVKRRDKCHIFSIITLATVYRFKESRTVMANDCEKEKYKPHCSFGYAAGIANACQKF